ncbi:unnamed protein product [Coregonus sp. 'balchen']|nr:unnamed protein product [Coregonus sp. 'balchen']
MSSLSYFTPAREEELLWSGNAGAATGPQPSTLGGEEARRFYQSLIEEGGGGERRGGLRLLRCAQEGDLSGVRGLLSRGVDVNFQGLDDDDYPTTGTNKTNQTKVNAVLNPDHRFYCVPRTPKGLMLDRTAIPPVLPQHSSRPEPSEPVNPDPVVSSLQCPLHCPPETHLSSTLHLFSLSRPAPPPHYCLPPSTPAYQMMLRSGWTPGGGLGPEGEGHKQPVRTVLKRDSRGLGYGPTPRPKVTHFQPKDPQAVRRTGKEGRWERRGRRGMKEQSKREEKDRNWERDFRSSFNTFDP